MDLITSRDNRFIKEAKSLCTKEGRNEKGMFLAEGYRNVKDAYKKGADIAYVLIQDGCSYDLSFLEGVRSFTLAKRIFDYVSDTVTPQGVIAVCKIKEYSFKDIELDDNSLIVVCENLQDPGNAGTIIRTADAVGAKAVIMAKGSVDVYNPKVVRSVMSSLFSVKVIRNKSLDSIFGFLEDNKIQSVGGALRDGAKNLFETDITGRCAIFVGNEGNGLSDAAVKRCKTAVKIPMPGNAESLNASVAAGVMMYEHVRQNNKI
jgi:TrmH family RNA methyltransferase